MSPWFETVDEANAEICRLEAELLAVLRQLKERRTTCPPVKGAKHTPGPWETELITERTRGGHRQYWTIFTRGETSRTLATVHPYGIVAKGGNEHMIAEADAQLMTAAPDLLAAWEAFFEAKQGCNDCCKAGGHRCWCQLAHTAIAKAK